MKVLVRVRHWLLLRGLTREARHWGAFPEVLARKLDAQVTTLDLPGAGTENQRAAPTTIPATTDDLRDRFVAQRTGAEAWGLLAVSMGGMVALDWCHRHGADFSRLVLINSSAGNVSPPHHRLRLAMVPSLVRTLRTEDRVLRERRVLEMTTNGAAPIDATAEAWARFAEERPLGRGVVYRQLYAALRFRAPERIGVPLLVLASARDRFTDPRCSQKIAARYGAPIELHPSAGHDLPLEDPAWITERIGGWLGSA